MKIKFDIDCTPEEARAFFGLDAAGPEALFKLWSAAAGAQGLEQMQNMWARAASAGPGARPGGAAGGGDEKP